MEKRHVHETSMFKRKYPTSFPDKIEEKNMNLGLEVWSLNQCIPIIKELERKGLKLVKTRR